MNTKIYLLLLVPVLWLLLVGCQGNPTVPGPAQDLVSARPELTTQPHQFMGYFDLVVDKEAQTVELTPVRTADLHLNLTGIFNALNSVGLVFHPELSDLPNGLVVVDFVITHPFPTNPELSAFDMKAILYSAGTLVVDTALVSDVDEPQMLNADGYTRWWNPTEFTNHTPFGYIESEIPHSPVGQLTATVNPYKLFADVLGVTDTLGPVANEPMDSDEGRAVLRAGSACTRRMEISFPMSPAQVIYGIGIDCSWDLPVPNPPVAVPDDFPIQANQPEAYRIHMNPVVNSLYYNTGATNGGGFLEMDITAWDWQGQQAGNIHSEIASVTLYSPALWTGGIAASYDSDTGVFAKYTADLTGAAVPTHVGPVKIFAKVQSVDGSYNQVGQPAPTDALSSWQALTLDVPEITCTGDSNNAWAEAVEIIPGTPIFDQICNVGDYNDYFFFTIPASSIITGNLRMECSASNITLGLYDNVMPTHNLIQEVTVTGGSGVIPVSTLGLFPGRYNIWIHNAGTETAPYKLELTGEMVDTTPLSPVDVTPVDLYNEPFGIIVHDNYAIMAPANINESTWLTYDVANPSNPVLAGSFEYDYPAAGPVFSNLWPMVYVGYFDGADCWIDQLDYTNPTAPVLTAKIIHIKDALFSPTVIGGIAVDENWVYVTINDGVDWWVVAYDKTDYTNFHSWTHLGMADFKSLLTIMDVSTWTDKYLVTAEYGGPTIAIFNITDPETTGIFPTDSKTFPGTWSIGGLRVKGSDSLYIAWDAPVGKFAKASISSGGTYIIPATQLDLPAGATSMVLDPNIDRAYVSTGFSGLTSVDIGATPPSIIHTEPYFETLCGFTLEFEEPNLVYATYLGWGGYEVIDVADSGNFQTLYHTTAINNPVALATQGNNMFVLDSDPVLSLKTAVKTVDITDPSHAVVTAEYWIDEGTNGPMWLEGNILAVGMDTGFKLLDVSDPLNVHTSFSYSIPAYTLYNLAIWDHYLYVGRDIGGPPIWIEAWDISDPASPVAPPGGSGFNIVNNPLDILFNGDTMYVNRGAAGVNDYSLSPDPLNPVFIAGYPASMVFKRARIENDMLYLNDKWSLEIVDISNPAVFSYQGEVAIPNDGAAVPDQLAVAGLFAFTSASPLIQSFNVWPATTPAYVAQVSDTEFAFSTDLMENNGFLYEADWGKGIRIYDLY